MTDFKYVGSELELFAHAINWKRYWGGKIAPFMGDRILEVGAGIGGTTAVLCDEDYDYWLGLEPDGQMVADLQARQQQGAFPACCAFREGTVATLADDEKFDSALYIDVLEHIEDDTEEIEQVAEHIAPGGYIIVLSPAFQFLYSEFDHAIGHYRRYTRSMLRQITPPHFDTCLSIYLDSLGMLLSLGNRIMLRAPTPTLRQIKLWDRIFVPASRLTDRLCLHALGRSVLHVWERHS